MQMAGIWLAGKSYHMEFSTAPYMGCPGVRATAWSSICTAERTNTCTHTLTLVLREFTDSRWAANMLLFTGGIKHWVLQIKACKSISTDECHRNKRDVGEMQYFKDHHCSFVLLLSEELCYWSQGEWKLVKITSVEMYVSIYAFFVASKRLVVVEDRPPTWL